MELLWSMYNKVEKLRIDNLSTDQVRTILLSVPTRRMEHWYACRQGNLQWRALGEISEFYEDVRMFKGQGEAEDDAPKKSAHPKKPTAPPLKFAAEERRPMYEDGPQSSTDDEIPIASAQVKERRSTKRVQRFLEFQIKLKDETFACQTHDISVQGLALNEPLPRWVPKTFRATLSHQKESVHVLCRRVSDTKLQLVDSEAWDVIRKWIVKW